MLVGISFLTIISEEHLIFHLDIDSLKGMCLNIKYGSSVWTMKCWENGCHMWKGTSYKHFIYLIPRYVALLENKAIRQLFGIKRPIFCVHRCPPQDSVVNLFNPAHSSHSVSSRCILILIAHDWSWLIMIDHVDGVKLRVLLLNAASKGPVVHTPSDVWAWRTTVV